MFGMMMTSLWKLFYFSPKKTETLREIQLVLKRLHLKVVKPGDPHWFLTNTIFELSKRSFQLSLLHSRICTIILVKQKLLV